MYWLILHLNVGRFVSFFGGSCWQNSLHPQISDNIDNSKNFQNAYHFVLGTVQSTSYLLIQLISLVHTIPNFQ